MAKERGFSLIELLMVVAIILIIAAIAVPNLLKSKMAANEASAAASLRTVATGNATYSTTYNIGFAGNLGALGPPAIGTSASSANANLIDALLAGCTNGQLANCPGTVAPPVKSGYSFTYAAPNNPPSSAASNASYSLVATPFSPNATGISDFCLDQTNIVLKDPAGAAAPTTASAGCAGFTGPAM